MVIVRRYSHIMVAMLAIAVLLATVAPAAHAAEGAESGTTAIEKDRQQSSVGYGLRAMGIAIGAGIAIAGAGLATGRAQAGVGAGGTGALAEKPELFGNVLILFAIPETIVVFGFVIAIMLVQAI